MFTGIIINIPQDHVRRLLERGEIPNIQFRESINAVLEGKYVF